MEERRKLRRRHVIYYSRVYERSTGELIGHVIDITPEGIKLISEQPIPVETHFHFRIDLPEEIMGRGYMFFEADSIWCAADANPDFYNTGFRVNGMDEQDVIFLNRMIDETGLRD
ncbi:MAG: PilZ domain-containing protein [Chloroflexota bacterium]